MNSFVRLIAVLVTLFLVASCSSGGGGASTTPAAAAKGAVSLPRTGAVTSYAGGDDGNLRKGVAWPSVRFTNNGDGTVTDNLTGLMWLKDANCMKTNYPAYDADSFGSSLQDGAVTWQHALEFVAGINTGTYPSCGGGQTGWRMANRRELRSLVDNSQTGPALPAGHLFTNVQTAYWSSTTTAAATANAWTVDINQGSGWADKTVNYYVWPVRDAATAGTVSLPRTGQTTSYATGDDGDLQKGVAWPNPRFAAGSGSEAECVTDDLTGLMWTINSNHYGLTMTWLEALVFIETTMNYGPGMCGHTDWRLPNIVELESLVDVSQTGPALPSGHPFTNVWTGSSFVVYWASTIFAEDPLAAWGVTMDPGSITSASRLPDSTGFVWPVRGGQ